jgi:hypothetical protein
MSIIGPYGRLPTNNLYAKFEARKKKPNDRHKTNELTDGYALRFPGSDTWANTLLQFITYERACCPFFTFALTFEPEQGPIWLHLRGPEGVKAIIENMLNASRQG